MPKRRNMIYIIVPAPVVVVVVGLMVVRLCRLLVRNDRAASRLLFSLFAVCGSSRAERLLRAYERLNPETGLPSAEAGERSTTSPPEGLGHQRRGEVAQP
jgi:hypothetical protein